MTVDSRPKRFAIGQASKRSGVKVTTIRYYEEIGLLESPLRSRSGRRFYSEEAIRSLRFIRQARDLGFPIESIRSLLALQRQPTDDCRDADDIARQHLEEVEARIRLLQGWRSELSQMIEGCEGGRSERCLVIESLLVARPTAWGGLQARVLPPVARSALDALDEEAP